MTRIAGVARRDAGPLVRLAYFLTRRQLGREVTPITLYAHQPRLLLGYGMFEKAVAGSARLDEAVRALVELKAAALLGCEFCIDIGSRLAREAGVSEDQLVDLWRHESSPHFDDRQRCALELAVGMTRTPVDVGDELFARLRGHFGDAELVELVNLIAVENLRSRFNAAFGIGAEGFSEGMVCASPETAGEAAGPHPEGGATSPEAANGRPAPAAA
jgi:4-carboxymuconolactone decarboxylase